ncbi:MAG: MgtC/SapB family protein [Longimicrobiales bacterium]
MDVIELRPDFLLQLGLAALLGGIIGLEREVHNKPAGFRTNLLICVGAALITGLSISIGEAARAAGTAADPARLAAQIVSGIGFLGAGTIMQARGSVVGLTTAATLWVVAAIGIAVGAGAFEEAVGTTALVMGALIILGKAERLVGRIRTTLAVRIRLDPEFELLDKIVRVLSDAGYRTHQDELEIAEDGILVTLEFAGRGQRFEDIVRLLLGVPGVRQVRQV